MKVECFYTTEEKPIPAKRVREVVKRVIAGENTDLKGEIRIVFVDDEYIHNLNKEFLHHDYPTDVISFTLEADNSYIDGEVYISIDRAREQAESLGLELQEELWRLIIHGTLHLLGYNDSTNDELQEMRLKEDAYLESFELKGKEL